jgi:Tfp pilus assembly protein PilX
MTFRLQPQGRRGIALVITLIMLSVTLVMAVAFLAISSRERNSVATTTDAAHARLATDAALAHAEAQVVASMLANTNPYNFGLLVSTNFINSHGYLHTLGANPTNVTAAL